MDADSEMLWTDRRSLKASGNAGGDGQQVPEFAAPDQRNAPPLSGATDSIDETPLAASAGAPASAGSGNPSWIGSLQDPVIQADMAAASVNGTVTEAGMAKLFTDLAAELKTGSTTLSASQFSDLQTIAANLNVGETASPYLTYITDALILGNAANADFTGGAANPVSLGNLAVGATSTQVQELAEKWFLGTDLPSNTVKQDGESNIKVTYSAVDLPLFGSGGPSVSDVNQGYIGDCFLEAALCEVAYQNPSMIESMITSNGNNTYGVRFFVNGAPEYVTVTNDLADGGTEFNYSANGLWASLAEQAYAQIQAEGDITGNGPAYYSDGNSFSTIANGGWEENTLEQITGATQLADFNGSGSSWTEDLYGNTGDYNGPVNDVVGGLNLLSQTNAVSTASVLSAVISALAAGDDVLLGSNTNAYDSKGNDTLVSDHVFAVYGYDSSTGELELRNPWGTWPGQYWDTTFEVSMSTLLAAGDTFSIDNARTPVPLPSLAITSAALQSNQTTVSLSGTIDAADAGLTISIYDGAAFLGTTTANSSGAWSTTVTASAEGVHTLTAQATNASGAGSSDTIIDLVDASTSLTGGGQTVLFSGFGDAVTLASTAGTADSVTGSGGTVTLDNAQASITGSDTILGGGGSDTVIFSGDRANYIVSHNATSATVTNISTGAVDTLTGIQTLQFADVSLPSNYEPSSDFYGTGTSDILLLNSATGSIVDWQMNGSQVLSTVALGGDPAWTVAGTGDFYGSGVSDILLYNSSTGSIVDWQMNAGQVASATALGGDPAWSRGWHRRF